jgi:2'-5' RNA ligase/GNAT superfamily N-acetyltransferase
VPERRRLLVALVLTGRVATEIDGLRRATGSRELDRIAPHLTLVAPRNVPAIDVEAVLATVRQVAARTAPLRLGLGPLAAFPPSRRVLYLQVDDPTAEVATLAGALASGPLAPPPERPSRPFVAHVTVTNRATEQLAAAALASLDCYRVETEIGVLSLLEMAEGVPSHPWRILAEVPLGAPTVRGRGGFEVTVRESVPQDPDLARFLDTARGGDASTGGVDRERFLPIPLTLGAWVDGRLVGAISGRLRGALLSIDAHLVAVSDRGLGVGTQLLSAVELLATGRGATVARLVVDADTSAAAYYAGRGYELVARFAAASDVPDEVLLSRSLPAV